MNIKISKKVFLPCHLPTLMDYEHRVLLFYGGGSSGKSYFAYQRALYKSLSEPKRKTLIIRKTATDCRRSCFEDMKRTLEQFKIADMCVINKSTMDIVLPNKSTFLFMGLDDPQKIKSIPDINDIIVEECSEITYDDYCELKGRTRGSGKLKNQIVMMMNPVSKVNWTYKFFFKDGCKEEDCIIRHSTYKDNPFCNDDVAKAYEGYKETNPMYYNVYCLGEFGSLSKTIFTNWEVQDFDIDDIKGKDIYGADWGWNDPTTIMCSRVDESNKTLYIYQEHYESGMDVEDIANTITQMGLKRCIIYADCAEPITINTLNKKGYRGVKACKKGAGSILAGIRKLWGYNIIVHPSCIHTIEELENYSWKMDKKTSEYIEEPEANGYDHCLDALRYSLEGLDNVNKVRSSINISRIGL